MRDGKGNERRAGFLYALGAFGLWGLVLPVYIKALAAVPVAEILAHRVVWAALLALALLALLGRLRVLRTVLILRSLGLLVLSAALVTINWVTYVVAVTNDHLLAASLGYFLNPLVSIALGMLVLGERLRPRQLWACAIAAFGVLILAAAIRGVPWIALSLALSFGCYGLVRKVVAAEALAGFTFEVTILAPFAAGYLLWLAATGRGAFALASPGLDLLLLGSGLFTALPLVWFAAAARKLPLTTIGLLQFTAPSAAFLLGVFVYGEPFGAAQAACFGCIWLALAVYSLDAVMGARASAIKAPGAASD
jgi:chloramphenicol-sensitive protein RarD